MGRKSHPRLFAILPREGRCGIVLRRGPAKCVQLIRWDTVTDSFEPGQWFKGRIYERRCDLSPSGEFLIYFAGNQRPPYRTWTAVSRPPYFTALALWPNGSTWGGGGLFENDNMILVNQQMNLAEGFSLPATMLAKSLGCNQTHLEGFGIYQSRLQRDGWTPVLTTTGTTMLFDAEVYSKNLTVRNREIELEMWLSIADDWRKQTEYLIKEANHGRTTRIANATWADFDRSGDLVFASEGKLFRTKPDPAADEVFDPAKATELFDSNDLTFTGQAAPDWARRWD